MKSSRVIALTLVVSLGASVGVIAQEPLLQSTSRAVQKMEQEQGLVPAPRLLPGTNIASQFRVGRDGVQALAQQASGGASETPPILSKSHMRMRTRLLIYGAIGAGFAVGLHAIDHHQLDVTPSHLGTRKDGCSVVVFGC